MERSEQLHNWLRQQFGPDDFEISPASSDASFRRYFRVERAQGTHIVMDAPPSHEDCRPFIKVARLFEQAGVHVPHIHAENLEAGFLLLSDMGNRTYLDELNPNSADAMYRDATDALIKIQQASRPDVLPEYDASLLLREMQLFPEWYAGKHFQYTFSASEMELLERVFALLISNSLAQPKVYVHRDYHSRNLMVSEPNPGILDFQDAVYGPITYDLVSLWKDAYIQWDEEQVLDWLIRYWEKARKAGLPVSQDFYELYRDFEWMGIQRHLKVLGIFARLNHRDGKDGYLKDLPLVLDYVRKAAKRYDALTPLLYLLDRLEGKAADTGYTF